MTFLGSRKVTEFYSVSLSETLSEFMIHLKVNGETRQCEPETTLPDFLQQLGLNPRLIAIEYNGEILHRQFWQQTEIQEGDCLEIVTIVGGG